MLENVTREGMLKMCFFFHCDVVSGDVIEVTLIGNLVSKTDLYHKTCISMLHSRS